MNATNDVFPLRDHLIETAEIDAERTVSLVRLLVAFTLVLVLTGSLAIVSGEPPPVAERQLGQAWIVLSAFALLGVASYWLAQPGRFRPWMPWLFTTADAAFVVFNVHTNLVNQDVGPAYLTLFPAAWIAPLAVSFGVLRYRPGLQAYAGLLLLGGIGLLVVLHGGQPLQAMPDYLFHGPPNAARFTLFAALVVLLVVAARRRRRLLTRAIHEVEQRSEYQRYLPPAIAGLVADGKIAHLRHGWRTEAAVVLVDIRGFTRLAENMTPEELSRFVNDYRRRLTSVVEQRGGLVDKFVGDGAVVLFGALGDDDQAAGNALACTVGLTRDLATIADRPVRLAIGAHWGEVYAGAVGDEARLEFTVLGDTVNVAARLEGVCKAEDQTLVVSGALLRAAGTDPADGWMQLAVTNLRGREGALDIYAFRG